MSQQLLDAGVYTPTYTNTTNLDASTPAEHQWFRVGNLVHVSGSGAVDPTAAAPTSTQLRVSLPIPSAFSAGTQASGTMVAAPTDLEFGVVASVASTQLVAVNFMAVTTASHTIRYEFTYQLINV